MHAALASPPLTSLANPTQVLVILDLQEGLYSIARDWDATLYRDSMLAHSALGTVFKDLPVIMTTSAENGMSLCVTLTPLFQR